MLKKIPYGMSDFKRVQQENYYFIDKTRFIIELENQGSFLMFLRPRRFGKSLLVSMLESYYDVAYKDEFEDFFKESFIFNHKTSQANKYLVLKFDFSAIDVQEVASSFRKYLLKQIDFFITKYSLNIEMMDNPIDMLNAIFIYLKGVKKSLYILIDEYDNFSNKLLLENRNNYQKIISNKTAMFKQFFTTLKAGTSGTDAPLKRIFITGVTPMTSYDVTSGFNIGKNISLNPFLNDLIGINSVELEEILNYYNLQKIDKALLKEWYNNYKFSRDAQETIYNTDMVLYYMDYYLEFQKAPEELIDINVRSDYSQLRNIIYTDGKLNGNFGILNTLISGECIFAEKLVQDFSALNLSKEENFKSLLFYLGLVTIDKAGIDLELKIPNETIKRIDIDFLKDSLAFENIFDLKTSTLSHHLKEFALNGDIEVFQYLADEIKKSTGIRDYIYNEQSVKAMYLAYLSLTSYYVIKSEAELNKGFADIFLRPFNPYVTYIGLVELKYIKRTKKVGKKLLKRLVEEATLQLEQYAQDSLVTEFIQKKKQLQKVVLVFNGWELIYCEAVC